MQFPRRSVGRSLGAGIALLLLVAPVMRAAPALELVGAAHAWQRAEFLVHEAPVAANNFDPALIRIEATVTAPSGRALTVPAFWHQEFTRALAGGAEQLTPRGAPHWRVRYTPTEPGRHTVQLTAWTSATATTTPAPLATLEFTVGPAPASAAPGWVRVADDRRTFATTDGRALLLSGRNVCWPEGRGTFDYDAWFAALAAGGQNFARLWLAPWWAALEHTPGTLNRYRLDAAWQLDQIFAAAERHGLYLLLCLDHHGMYQASDTGWGGSNNFWPTNPYSAQQGGPCAHPSEFFRSPAAMELYQKRLRYLIARYGGHPRLLAWQFFNEIDNIFDRAPVDEATVVAWHVTMARWLRAHDPYQHLISTSLTGGVDRPAFWNLPEMEFSSYHAYYEPAPGRRMAALVDDFTRRYAKPAIIGEFGVDAAQWSPAWDPHLRGFRQNLWAGALGGSAGTGLSWWWEDVHRDGAGRLEAVLTRVLRDAGWFEGGWAPLRIGNRATPEPPKELGEPLADAAPFHATLALNNFRRLRLDGAFAVASPLAADRASEHLSSVLWGSRQPDARRPLRITAWTTADGRLTARVQDTTGDALFVARVDGREVWRVPLAGPAGPVARDFTVALPAGRHVIELANEGAERINLASLRLEGVRPAAFAPAWRYAPEAFGLRRGGQAALYVVAPAAVYPAGAIRYELPAVRGETVALADWPAGAFTVRWLSPETGAEVAAPAVVTTTAEGALTLPLPDFSVDVVGIVAPAP